MPTGGFLGPRSQAGPAGTVSVPERCPLAVWGVRRKEGWGSEVQTEPEAATARGCNGVRLVGLRQAERGNGGTAGAKAKRWEREIQVLPLGSEESGPCSLVCLGSGLECTPLWEVAAPLLGEVLLPAML